MLDRTHLVGCPAFQSLPALSAPLTAEAVRAIIREEITDFAQRLAGALGAAADPALPAMPANFDEALQLVNGAQSLAGLMAYADSEAAGLNREGLLEAVRFRRQELLEAAGGDHR